MSSNLLRLGAVAAFLAVIAQLAVAFVEPGRSGDADEVIRDIAESGNWTGRWLVHLAGIVLIVLAWAVVTRTFSVGAAKEWSRVGLVFVAITGALGMAQILVGAGTKDLADGWAAAAPGEKPAYFAAFDGAWNETVNLDFGTIMAGGLYLLTLAAAILSGSVYARWLGWVSAGAGVLLLVGTVLELWSPVGTALGLVGILLLLLVLSGLGISMWRNAAFHAQTVQTPVEPQDVT